jgi:hypothetical protein
MNFPMDEPFFQAAYWLMNTPGLGGIVVTSIVFIFLLSAGLTLRWIALGARAKESTTYSYPTPALHHHSQEGAL